MTRLVETARWRDPWRRKLSTQAKLFFDWLCDNCDNAGVIELDLSVASFDIGEPIDESHLAELGDRVQRLPNGKFNIVKFVAFQYKTLIPSPGKDLSNLKKSAIRLLQKHGLPIPEERELHKPSERAPRELSEPTSTSTGTVKSISTGTSQFELMRENLNGLFDRDPKKHWSSMEEQLLFGVVQENPDCLAELADLRNYERKTKYFPKSITSLLSDWGKHLDAAKSETRNGQKEQSEKPKTIMDKELESIRKAMERI